MAEQARPKLLGATLLVPGDPGYEWDRALDWCAIAAWMALTAVMALFAMGVEMGAGPRPPNGQLWVDVGFFVAVMALLLYGEGLKAARVRHWQRAQPVDPP